MGETTSRRTVLLGAGAVGAAGLLAACGAGETEQPAPNQPGVPNVQGQTGPGGAEGIPVDQVPDGGGVIDSGRRVVVTQPEAGEYKAFDATCTHEGCIVTSIASGMINCACHNSQFRIEDGSVARGPATRPLPEKTTAVESGVIVVS